MSKAIALCHGSFGRASLYLQDRDMATHAHREGHLIFYVSGRYPTIRICDEPHVLTPDFATAINPWQPHSYHSGDIEHGSFSLVLYIRPEWFLHMARSAQYGLRFGRSVIEMTPSITELVKRVTYLLLEGAETHLLDGYLFELTQGSFEQSWQWTNKDDHVNLPCAAPSDFRIRKSIGLMKSRIGEGEGISFDAIARDAGLSRPHFFKLFRENTGLTPNIYLNTLRMETAIDMLTSSSDAVTSIGLDLGFSSQASFTRFFISNVGIPPSNYRRVVQMAA